MNLDNLNEVQTARQTNRRRYFEAMAWFESPDKATEAGMALASVGYVFEQTPYVYDEKDGFLFSSTVYGVISGTGLDEGAISSQLREIIAPLGGCDACGFEDAPTSQAERYKRWTGKDLADPNM
jgi:hypothetical protein